LYFIVEFPQQQLKNLKDNLKKCLDKRTKMTRSGAAASSLPTCKYFAQMSFLYGSVGNRPTESNLCNLMTPPSTVTQSPDTQTEADPSTSAMTETVERETHANKRPISRDLFSNNRSRNRMNRDVAELMLLKQLNESDMMCKKMTEEDDDEDLLFCRSLVPILKEIPTKKRRLARIKMSQLLFDMQYSEEDN